MSPAATAGVDAAHAMQDPLVVQVVRDRIPDRHDDMDPESAWRAALTAFVRGLALTQTR